MADEAIVLDSFISKIHSTGPSVKPSVPQPNRNSNPKAYIPPQRDPTHRLHQQSFTLQDDAAGASNTSTPSSFAQITSTNSPNGPNHKVKRGGGRWSRGIRHKGAHLIGGSMSVFSVKSNEPTTPTQRTRGSTRGKPSQISSGGSKRKRSNENAANDSDSSEAYTPLSQSRSGRKIIQTAPIIKIEELPDNSPKSNTKTTPAKPNVTGTEKKRSNFKRTPGGASAVCKNCGRLHSPESNAMVFCDGCNTGWHQYCHDPPIPQEIVIIESKEWFCTDCVVLKEEKVRLQGKVSGQHMSLLEKRRHLQTLSSKELVSLLLYACSVHPELSVFSEPDEDTAMAYANDDEEMLSYPRPGNGVLLPPEKDNLHFLLDDDADVYSHCTSGIAQLVAAARANLLRRNSAGIAA